MSLKILHCIHSLHGGGAERQLTVLSNHLDGTDLEFAVFCVDDSINDIDNPYCQVLTPQDSKSYPWGMIKEVKLAIDAFQPDLVHCWLPPSVSAPALIAAKLKGVPAVASYRNKKIFESWIRWPEFFSTLFCAKSIASNNPAVQSSYLFRTLFKFKKGVEIPNAVAVDEAFLHQREKVKGTNPTFRMLFVGRLTHQKNWQVMLQALALISADKEWELLICGKGEDEQAFNEMAAQLGLCERIKMLGYRTDVYHIMTEADLLILPSWYEGMPNVVLEAMCIGLPSVVSTIPAHTALFDDESGVCFFDPNDESELARVLADLIDGAINVERLSHQGWAFVERFTPKKLLSRYEKYYLDVVK
jgi:glycosyltransferase involved in cell wall biosynthesis